MNASAWIPLLAAVVAGLVALIGYSLTQYANRRERKSKSYAEALAAIREYQELPYLIRRRPDSNGDARSELAQRISEVMAKLGFYKAWLKIDSSTVSAVYDDLVDRTRQLGRDHLRAAWAGKVIRRDTEMIGTAAPFDWPGIDAKLDLCILAMRQELSFWGFKSRRSRQGSLGQTTSEKGGGKRQ